MKQALASALLLVGLAACRQNLDNLLISAPQKPAGRAALAKTAGCAEVQEALLQQRLYELETQLRANELQALQTTCEYYSYGYGVAEAAPTASASSGATQVSTTNVQVANIDEPDFVKNDNQYIYQVSNGALHSVRAYPAASMREVGRVAIDGEPRALFVNADTAIVYAALGERTGQGTCTYGYGCEPTGDGTSTRILVFNIHDRAAPVEIRRIDVASSFIAARRIGTAVYTVFTAPPARSYVPMWPEGLACNATPLTVMRAFDELRAKDIALVKAAYRGSGIPTGSDSVAPGTDIFGGCNDVYKSGIADGDSITSVVSFDLASGVTAHALSVVGRPGFTYASKEALYMAVRHTPAPNTDFVSAMSQDGNEISTIHKFALDARTSSAVYVATGVVPGHVIDQFSMDEADGFLRVAGTHGMVGDTSGDFSRVSSSVTVMAQQGGTLVRVAGIDGIAPNEDSRSVRFDGDRGFVCTFKKTDPLFVFDLHDPEAPRQLGELQVPGFSTYMQMMDANHLLTIGFDADDQGAYALFQGILLQIFDVADPSKPAQIFREVIGTRGSGSAALTDHLAFNYFPAENLLAIPVTICDERGMASFNGLRVYKVTVADGFALLGQMASAETGAVTDGDPRICDNWWSNSTSTVKRSVIMDNDVYAVSRNILQADDLSALGQDIAQVSFTAP